MLQEKTIQQLNLEDDFLFAKVMSDPEICRKVLEKILRVPIERVSAPSVQQTLQLLYEGKGIRLDVYVHDNKGSVYNVEMERGKQRKSQLPKRSRYYQSSIDLDCIARGEDYRQLKKSFVIFICTFDPFGEGRHQYTFENRCLESPNLALGDEAVKIFLNTKGIVPDIDPEVRELLSYIENTTDSFAAQAESPLIREIHKKVTHIKSSKEMEAEYMTLMQRDRENIEEGIEKGRELGRAEGRAEGRHEGRKEGNDQMASLIQRLLSENRIEDLKRASEDADFRNQLFREYGI